jgi:hypothetical protein
MKMKRISLIFCLMAFMSAASALPASKTEKTPQHIYIERYSTLAVEEMYRSGVPASITLAQGLLESRYGLSELAVEGNNHFGIKCHNNWNGGKMYHDDDRRGECFRKYDSPEESFRDHSDFLRYRDRYKFLFDLDPTDYKGWAHGLKKAGYATDSAYPQKLIRLIEEYDLHRFDMKPSGWEQEEEAVAEATEVTEVAQVAEEPVKEKQSKADRKSRKKNRKDKKKDVPAERPESPSSIEQAKPLTESQRETFRFALSRRMYSMNGVPFVYSAEGETYSSIAARYNLFLGEILKFNDLDAEETLHPGTVVYLQKKKKEAAYGMDKFIVEGSDTELRDIAQRFALRLDKLCRMNGFAEDYKPKDGEVIMLRK